MANEVLMPQIGLNEESNVISNWHKKEGEKVEKGDVLFSVETDKSSMDVESEYEGVLLKAFYNEWDAVQVLTPVCVIGEEGEDISEISISDSDNETKQEINEVDKKNDLDELVSSILSPEIKDTENFIKISPRAKTLAEKKGVDPKHASPTGPHGRIIERDIYTLAEQGPKFTKAAKNATTDFNFNFDIGKGIGGSITTSDIIQTNTKKTEMELKDYEIVKLSNIRKIIGQNMMNSLQSTAQLTLNTSFDAANILNYRKQIKDNKELLDIENITLNDMIMFAVSRTIKNHLYLNAHLLKEEEIKLFNNVHLGFACDTDRGLMVPTIKNSDLKSLNDITKESKALIKECQSGSINPDKLKDASFTVSNLGSFGIESFTPVLNPPQTGLLGIGTIEYKIKKVNDKYVEYPAMFLSLTFDHRAIDGAPAAKFLKDLKNNLEKFNLLLAK